MTRKWRASLKAHKLSVTLGCCELHDASRKFDPTGTKGIRRKFEADLTRRFRAIKGLIFQSVVKNDAFGIGKFGITDSSVIHTRDEAINPARFAFSRSSEKVSGFMAWLKEQEEEGILGIMPGTPIQSAADDAWSNVYIERSYKKGASDAARKLNEGGATVRESWVNNMFNRPIHADRVGIAYTRTFSELAGITDAMDQQISRVLAAGLEAGKGPMQIARGINDMVDKIGITRARTLARTEVVNAHASATLNSYEEAGIEGVEVESEFTTAGDDSVCPICEALEGRTYTLSEARGVIPVHPNCLPGDSLVLSRSGISAASKRWFDGDMIIINSSSGRVLSCTPNHPVLTSRGWVAAKDINLTDQVICDGGSEWVPVANSDDKNVISSIHDIAESFRGSREVSSAPVPTTREHFHGDGIDGEIAVIWTDSKLRGTRNASFFDLRDNKSLNSRIMGYVNAVGFGALAFFFKRMRSTFCGFVRGRNLGSPLALCHEGPFQLFGFRLGSKSNTSVLESVVDSVSADAKLASDLIDGRSCKVFADDIIDIKRKLFSGHVYNLETGEGWYSANGIITHNCRCAWSPKVINGTGIELV